MLQPREGGERGPAAVVGLLADPGTKALLQRYGAILFRGFDLQGATDFNAIVEAHYGPASSSYAGGFSPRSAVPNTKLYESTTFASHLPISQHNEMSYLADAPADLFFFCETPPENGGETPITDCRQVLAAIPDEIRRAFEERGLRYSRHHYGRFWLLANRIINHFTKLHRSWRDTFETRDKDKVAAACKRLGLQLRWRWDDSLSVWNERPAIVRHPGTGQLLWFNQVAAQRVTPKLAGWPKYLSYELWYRWLSIRPFEVSFADGKTIPIAYADAVREATERHTVSFPWEKGDLLWIDNFLVTHGRRPFKGPRRILVAIGPTVTVTP